MTATKRVDKMCLHWKPLPHQGGLDLGRNYQETIKIVEAAILEEREACAKIANGFVSSQSPS